MKNNKSFEIAEALSDAVNSSLFDRKEFAQIVTTEHRFLQQEMFLAFLKCVEGWAKNFEAGNYDDRNEYTCKASHVILEALKENNLF